MIFIQFLFPNFYSFFKCTISVLTCKISKKGIFFHKSPKKFFLFFMGDVSPNAHESKSMIGLVPSAQQLHFMQK